VVNKGPETPDTFARRVLEDLYDRLPIMVMNDETPLLASRAADEELTREERKALEGKRRGARLAGWFDASTTAPPIPQPSQASQFAWTFPRRHSI